MIFLEINIISMLRLVFDWVDKKNLSIYNTKDLKSNFDYLLLHKSENTPFLKIEISRLLKILIII